MLLIPKNKGLKNIILVKTTVIAFLSPENPGAIKEITKGANKIKIPDKIISISKTQLKRPPVSRQASFSSFLKYWANIGMKAEEIAPMIKML